MSFHSLEFLAFLLTFFAAYWSLRGKARLSLCLGASLFFYGWWDYRFLSLLILSVVVDFIVGRSLGHTSSPAARKVWLSLSLLVNFGVLATFKYFDFFSDSLNQLAGSLGWKLDAPTLDLILPLGISFYTFQTLSYSIDVYRGTLRPERSLLKFATYVTFFPQLVAGPIVRASEFLPQLASDRRWSLDNFQVGFGLILLGFFKKLVVADNIAFVADHLYGNPEAYTSVNVIIILVLYAFQIYGDFSGYSDIAIGIALTMGFVFPVNFRFPYFARSFRDFWSRWHITLSSWIRDYLYIPLGGSRNGRFLTSRNLLISMLLGGLWHGANWTFVAWGTLHGLLLVAQNAFSSHRSKNTETNTVSRIPVLIHHLGQITIVFCCVCALWVLFRSQDIQQAAQVFEQVIPLDGWNPSTLKDRIPLLKACLLVTMLVAGELVFHIRLWHWVETRVPLIRMLGYASLVWLITLFGFFDGNTFIYFQF